MRALTDSLTVLLAALVAGLPVAPAALADPAQPVLEEVVSGQVTLERHGDDTRIDASHGSIGNYSSFDVGAGTRVDVIIEQGGDHLARVLSVDPTHIDGTLFSNGHVYLVNPAGVYFGAGAQVDAAGLHAAAGRIDVDGDSFVTRSEDSESARYFDLEGTVQNLGTINAAVVDLVGRHVVNDGTIAAGAQGFFVLVVGDDVTIVRETGPDGELQVGVTIDGLADELLAGLPDPGMEIGANSEITAGSGQALFALGAGDLVGAAMHYAGRTAAAEVDLVSVGADIHVDGQIVADTAELCASSACFDAARSLDLEEPIRVPRELGEDAARDTITLGENADFSGGSLRVQQEGALDVGADVAFGLAGDLFLISGDEVSVEADAELAAGRIGVRSGADGTGDLALGAAALRADEILLRAGDGALSAAGDEAPAARVRIDAGASFRSADGAAAPRAFSVTQDAALDADAVAAASQFGAPAAGETMTYRLRSEEGGATIDAGIADELSDDPVHLDWDLSIAAAGDLAVQSDLGAASLELQSGVSSAPVGPDTVLSVGGEDAPAVALRADRISLLAGSGRSASTLDLAPDTVLAARDGDFAPDALVLGQDAGLDEQILLNDAIRGMAIEDSLALTLRSDWGSVSLDPDSEALGADERQEIEDLLAATDLTLMNEGTSAGGITVGTLSARSLTLSTRVGASVTGDLVATDGDVTLLGTTSLVGDGDQTIEAVQGRVRHAGVDEGGFATLHKLSAGSLILLAGAAPGVEQPIDLDQNVVVDEGDLVLGSASSLARNVTVQSGRVALLHDARFDGEGGQTLEAATLGVDASVTRVAPGDADGALVLRATGGDADFGANARVASHGLEIDADRVNLDAASVLDVAELDLAQNQALDGTAVARALAVADGASRITLESRIAGEGVTSIAVDQALDTDAELGLRAGGALSVNADVTAAALSLRSGTAGAGDLTVAEAGPVRLQADTIELRAGSGTGAVAAVVLGDGVELANRAGDAAPASTTVRQDAGLDVADFAAARGATLRFASDGGDVQLDDAWASAETATLELAAAGDVALHADVEVDTLLAEGGTDGTGDVVVGLAPAPEGEEGEVAEPVRITARTVTLRAGDGSSSGAQVRVGDASTFDDASLDDLTLEQGAWITEETLPDLGDFDGRLVLRSTAGAVQLASSGRIDGTDLTLAGRDGVVLAFEDGTTVLDVRALHVLEEGESQLGPARFELHHDVNASESDIDLALDTVLRGARLDEGGDPELRALVAAGDLHAARSLSYVPEAGRFAEGSGLVLQAGGELRLDGPVEFGSTAEGPALGVHLIGHDVLVGDVRTWGDGETGPQTFPDPPAEGSEEPFEPTFDGRAAPFIWVDARGGQARLAGTLAARSISGEDVEGDIEVRSPGGIELGSEAPLGEQEAIELLGRNVRMIGDVTRTPVRVAGEDGSEIDRTDEYARDLRVNASGAAELLGSLAASGLVAWADDDLRLASDVTLHPFAGAGELAGSLDLQAGRDGSGDLVLEGERIVARHVALSAGEIGGGDPETARLLLGGVTFRDGDGSGPESFSVAQEGDVSAARAAELLSHIEVEQEGTLRVDAGTRLGLRSLTGTLRVDAADVKDTWLVLTALETDGATLPIEVNVEEGAALDVGSLELNGRSRIGGDLRVRAGSLNADADLVVAGDADLDTEALFGRSDGDPATQFTVEGALRAAKLDTVSDPPLVVDAAEGVSLFGSYDERSGRLIAVDADGPVSFVTPAVRLGGDVIAAGDVDLSSPGEITLDGSLDQRILSTGGGVFVTAPLAKRSGRRVADRSLTIGGEHGFDFRNTVEAGHDLVLVGPGVVHADGGLLRTDTGSITLATNAFTRPLSGGGHEGAPTGGIDATDVARLALEPGAGIAVGGSGAVANEIELRGSRIELAGDLSGAGNLTVDVTGAGEDGHIRLAADADLADSSTLTLASRAEGGIEFTAADGGAPRMVRAGSIALNPEGRADAERATIGAGGDLSLEASAGDVRMGTGEILTVPGALEVTAAGTASLGQLNALALDLSAAHLKPNAPGVDWNANRVFANQTPGGAVIGTPTTAEVSDELVDDDVLLRALRDDLGPLTLDDLRDAEGRLLDVTPHGPTRFEVARQIAVDAPPPPALPKQVLGQMNLVAAERRPLLADEVFAFLDERARGGETLAQPAAADDRFAALGPAVDEYRDLFAPVSRIDRDTGAPVLRSHRPRIRAALAAAASDFRESGAASGGAAFASWVAAQARHGEAAFYLSSLRELVAGARAGGLDAAQEDRFRELLVEDLASEDAPAELLVEAIR